MNEWQISFILIGTLIGGFAVGCLWAYRETAFWRIKWIKSEHKLARLENREPRDIKEIKR